MIYQIGFNILANFKIQEIHKGVQFQVRAVVMGRCGSGKTNLFNNLCDTSYDTGIDMASKTKEMDCSSVVNFPNNQFLLYDTPGINANQDIFEHGEIIKSSLTSHKLNLIIINEKINVRMINNFNTFQEQSKIFKNYEKMVVFLISHFDILSETQKQQILQIFQDYLKNCSKQLKIILYSNRTSDIQRLAQILYKLGQANEQQFIKIEDQLFQRHFQIAGSNYIIQQLHNYIQQIKDQADIFLEYRSYFPNHFEEFISDLKCFMKYHLKQLQLKQYKEYSEKLNNDSCITDLFLTISSLVQSMLEKFDKASPNAVNDMKNQHLQNECCPKCKVVWSKQTRSQAASVHHLKSSFEGSNCKEIQLQMIQLQKRHKKYFQNLGNKVKQNKERVEKDEKNEQKIQKQMKTIKSIDQIKRINELESKRNTQLHCLKYFKQVLIQGKQSQFHRAIESYKRDNNQEQNHYLNFLDFIQSNYHDFSQIEIQMVSCLKGIHLNSVDNKLSQRCIDYYTQISNQIQFSSSSSQKIKNEKRLQQQYTQKNKIINDKLKSWEKVLHNKTQKETILKLRLFRQYLQSLLKFKNQYPELFAMLFPISQQVSIVYFQFILPLLRIAV